MVGKARENVTESPKAEVGEIDTRAPFESVKAAVSLFGEGAFGPGKHIMRKPKPLSAERAFVKETELHLAQKELNKFKEQLNNAETTRIQALAELEKAKQTVEDLTYKLKAINESKELAIKATEVAKFQSNKLEEASSGGNIENGSFWRHQLDNARDQYAVAIAELDVVKQELRQKNKDYEASIIDKISAIQQEAEAKQLADANKEKAAQLSKDIAALQESLVHAKRATVQAQEEESKILLEKDDCRQSYRLALGETERRLSTLKNEFNPELARSFEKKLAEVSFDIGVTKKAMENARASDLDSLTSVTTELDGAKGVLQKVAEEESSLRSMMELLKVELESVKKEHQDLREKEAETESIAGRLHMELQKKMAELETSSSGELEAQAARQDLISALQQLSSESENAQKEAETMKNSADELAKEAKSARVALDEAEKNLNVALKAAEAAKAAEASALKQIKILSEKTNATRSSTSEFGAKIRISAQEYETLNRKVEEAETLAKMKVAAAMAQVEAVRASENEAIKRLEASRKEMEEMAVATEEALKRAEMAEAARRAVEGEMRRWRERDQKAAKELASRVLAETQMSTEALQRPKDSIPKVPNLHEKSDRNRKVEKSASKKLLPYLSGLFQRKRNQVEGGSPSYLPGEGPI